MRIRTAAATLLMDPSVSKPQLFKHTPQKRHISSPMFRRRLTLFSYRGSFSLIQCETKYYSNIHYVTGNDKNTKETGCYGPSYLFSKKKSFNLTFIM